MTKKEENIKRLKGSVIARKGHWMIVQPDGDPNSRMHGGYIIHNKIDCIISVLHHDFYENTFFWGVTIKNREIDCPHCGAIVSNKTKSWFVTLAKLVLPKTLLVQ